MVKKKKLVRGVGTNDADYVVRRFETIGYENGKQKQKLVWECPFYRRWCSMLKRCYEWGTSYIGCHVCEEWLTFSNFKAWVEKQDWEGKELDKDLLIKGNRVYSPETCVLVDKRVNLFLTERAASRGQWLIGVYWSKRGGKFRASCGVDGKVKYLGLFDTELEAHKAWLAFKLEQARLLAVEQTDPRVAKALIERYENYITEDQ